MTRTRNASRADLAAFASKATYIPCSSRGRSPDTPRPRPPIPATAEWKGLLLRQIPAYPRSARKRQDRPVTPEVAGSSPVASVNYLQISIFCCRDRRNRPPASSHPAEIPHPNQPQIAARSLLYPRITAIKTTGRKSRRSSFPKPARRRAAMRAFRNAGAVRRRLGVPADLVGEEDDVALDGLGVDEAHRFLVARLAEEALARAEHDRIDLQPQLVDQVVLHQRAYELEAGGDDDFPV